MTSYLDAVASACERIAEARTKAEGLRIVARSGTGNPHAEITSEPWQEWQFFDADDMVLSVGAGMPLQAIHKRLAEHRMRLRINGWFEHETIGAAFATHRVGPDRQWDGGIRDFVIGIEYIDGLARHVKAGGRVVKNVTGYDLMRMMLGSMGGLGLITALNFKMMPAPLDATTLLFSGAVTDLLQHCQTLAKQQVPLEWCALRGNADRTTLALGIAGNAARQQRLRRDLNAVLGAEQMCMLEGDAKGEFAWTAPEQRLAACLQGAAPAQYAAHLHLRFAHECLAQPQLYEMLQGASRFQIHPFAADCHLFFAADALPQSSKVRSWVDWLGKAQGSVALERMSEAWQGSFKRYEPQPPGFALMQALKRRLDPDGVFDAPFYEVSP